MKIDLNCDLGEGFPHDEELMPLITSANIACGGHAGDEATMRRTVALAQCHGVAIGAHPGFADRENFGRRELAITPEAVGVTLIEQVGRLREIARQMKTEVGHVKLHGALYNMVSRDRELALAVCDALQRLRPVPVLFALAGSELEKVSGERGLRTLSEAFADRTYRPDGSLTPRSDPHAVISDENEAISQVVTMLTTKTVQTVDGIHVPIRADTICVHGDGPRAVAFARRLRSELTAREFSLASYKRT
jgi:UPF0271 protein